MWQGSDWQTRWWGSGWWMGQSHIHMRINQEKTTGEQDRMCNPGFQHQKIKASKPLTLKTWGGGRNCQSHRRVHWRGPQGPRMYISPPTRKSAPEQHLEGHNSLGGSDFSVGWEQSKKNCSLSDLSPIYSVIMKNKRKAFRNLYKCAFTPETSISDTNWRKF